MQKLAQLAQVGVSEQEAAEWGPKIAGIVEWFGQLQQVDLEGVPPAVRADIGDANLLRPDQPRDFENRQVIKIQFLYSFVEISKEQPTHSALVYFYAGRRC